MTMDAFELERQYRVLYWEHNEYQIIGTRLANEFAATLALKMKAIVAKLGYEPVA